MNENQSIIKNYLLILKTLHGDPGENLTVVIKGDSGQTEKLSLGKSQSHHKAFKHNQTDLFLLLSNIDVGKVVQLEFHKNSTSKFKEWKFDHVFVINKTRIYRNTTLEYFLLSSSSNDTFSVVNLTEPITESQGAISLITSRKLNMRDNVVIYLRMKLFLILLSSSCMNAFYSVYDKFDVNAALYISLSSGLLSIPQFCSGLLFSTSIHFLFVESCYYAFIKTGNDSCSKACYPVLSLFGNNQQQTNINLKSSARIHSSSTNNSIALEKYQFDIFQWQDHNIGNIDRMRLQLCSENKESKCRWPIEWMFIIHHGYNFTGRIIINRMLIADLSIDIALEQKILPIPSEHGDFCINEKKQDNNMFLSNILNQQANAITEDVGRYYVIIRNVDGTSGDVYLNFHGDLLSSSGEQHLLKCENYPEHQFTSKHTDLFHIKALEVGHIQSVSIRLDQTNKEHSLTLDSLYIIHNATMYTCDSKQTTLNKEKPNKKLTCLSKPPAPVGKVYYYIATHTADKMISGTNASFKVVVTGTKGILGPMELRESLTNGNNPFEKECIDLFHIEDDDIGDPISITITLEPNGLMSNIFSGVKCERIMLVKNGEYNSLWQLVGDLKIKESKTIPLPAQQKKSIQESNKSQIISVQDLYLQDTNEITPLYKIDQFNSLKSKLHKHKEKISTLNDIENSLSSDIRYDDLTMTEIEEHQKRHIFAPTLHEAEENYRELRRLLRKMNTPISKAKKIQMSQKQSMHSTREKNTTIS
ncbi:unnamed protein product [Rotaria socialis]|uniref:PLAT domain-containing protein n=1 Tax=Rotaria socialis TaxID=392032 RepID=A0A819ZY30_9BILA|nr:unnamed protein product [Rotaria socialis]CAF4181517.1 unnamed protein product [Rotaria socialis]CAF4548330.1 unnamed protein product [Rotaria socialis]